MSESNQATPIENKESCIEAILFVASGPVPTAQLATVIGVPVKEVEEVLSNLEQRYSQGSGLALQRHQGKVQLTTSPAYAGYVEGFLGLELTSSLSRAALETLAIIAYQQPITRPQVDTVRGVNSDGVMKSLLSKGLIQETGRVEGPGRPILYGTTPEFLQYFGISSLADLPPLDLPVPEPGQNGNNILKG